MTRDTPVFHHLFVEGYPLLYFNPRALRIVEDFFQASDRRAIRAPVEGQRDAVIFVCFHQTRRDRMNRAPASKDSQEWKTNYIWVGPNRKDIYENKQTTNSCAPIEAETSGGTVNAN